MKEGRMELDATRCEQVEKVEKVFVERKWVVVLVLFMNFFPLGASLSPNCSWDENNAQLTCSSILINRTSSTTNNLTHILLAHSPKDVSKVQSIEIVSSQISALRLNELNAFPHLRNLSIHYANITNLTGPVPQGLKSLDLSHNWLKHINFTTFPSFATSLQNLDLSFNNLASLPNNTFSLKLKRLNVIENPFRCKWVIGSSFSNWYTRPENKQVFQNIGKAFCRADSDTFGKMTFQSAVEIREKGFEECNKTPCECDLFTTIGNGKFPGKDFPVLNDRVSFTLKVDCSYRNLTELPPISKFTVLLAVEGNQIRDLSPLTKDPNYANLHTLYLNHNHVQDIAPLVNSSFFDRVQNLQLKHNHITQLKPEVIEYMFVNNNARRISNIALGNNMINCDCETVTKLKHNLVEHEDIIKDWKGISCRSPLVSLQDLRYEQVCYIEREESELMWYILIIIEVLLILIVLLKVWRDQRDYRRTGILPKCSYLLPRLPCDFMLEGIKDNHLDPNHHHRTAAKV